MTSRLSTPRLALSLALTLAVAGCGGGGSSGGGVAKSTVLPHDPAATPEPASATTDTSSSGSGTAAPAEQPPRGTTGAAATAGPLDLSKPSMGINLNKVEFFSPEWVFVDVMQMTRRNMPGFPWDLVNPNNAAPPDVDPRGYPIGLRNGQAVWTLALRGLKGRYPGGDYTVMFDGEGELELGWDAQRTVKANDGTATARFEVPVTPTDAGISVRIVRSNPANHVRNIRVIMPGFAGSYATQPFHPKFLASIAPFSVLRFMDWGFTNDSTQQRWADRTLPGARTQHRGVAYELMIDLANQTGKHPWICIPHRANDDYVRKLAELARGRLSPGLKLIVEYSNEVWNGAFDQAGEVQGWAKRDGVAWTTWYTRRSVQIFQIFEQVLGRDRLVRVLGSQAASPVKTQQIVNALPSPDAADAVAIAPYFGGTLGSKDVGKVRGRGVAQVLDACVADLPRWRQAVLDTKAICDAAGLALVAYEGGQHLAGVGSNSNDQKLTNLFIEANRAQRMGDVYRRYLAECWEQVGGGLFCAFNSCKAPNKHGSWGLMEHQEQTDHPKYRAVVDVAKRWGSAP